MKRLLFNVGAAALVLVAASPAMAKSKRHYYGARAQATQPYPTGGLGSGTNRFAPVQNYGGIDGNGPIYRNGRYLGQDPDPNIRAEIIRNEGKSNNR